MTQLRTSVTHKELVRETSEIREYIEFTRMGAWVLRFSVGREKDGSLINDKTWRNPGS